jgi:selenium metabolism protein YedF
MHKKVDLRGLTPPEPVVRTKRLLAEFEDGILEVLVDAGSSRDDILHFAAFKKYSASVVAETARAVRLKIVKGNPPPEEPEAPGTEEKAAPPPESEPSASQKRAAEEAKPSPRTEPVRGQPKPESLLLITSEGIGEDNRRLSTELMADTLRAIAESDRRPPRIVLMNSGVALACKGSPALDALRRMCDSGTEILVSAESLEFLGLRGLLAAGTAADVKQITEAILSAAQVTNL